MSTSAADIIRDARLRAALSQMELARQAGVSQSVISAYESGQRQPSMPMLRKLVQAAGFDLSIEVVTPTLQARRRQAIAAGRRELIQRFAELGATNVRLFGSVARGDDGPASDIDLLVDVDESVGLIALVRMQSMAEELFGSAVDVVPSNSLKPDAEQRIVAEAVAL